MNKSTILDTKKAIYAQCILTVQEQLDTIQSGLDQLMEAKNNETKSSAGDKYETGMAMIQNQERLYKRQLMDATARMNVLQSIDINNPAKFIAQGSLIKLNNGWFYMAVAIGKLEVNGMSLYIISKESPLGKLLHGKPNGETVDLNGNKLTIESIH